MCLANLLSLAAHSLLCENAPQNFSRQERHVMDTVTLGRTGLSASVMGLGCGGPSRLGMATGKTEAEAVGIVQAALDLGINFLDTAEVYGTEVAVGQALTGRPRDTVILSTKVPPGQEERLTTGAEFKERVNGCLRRLRTDHVDILHLHGVAADEYAYAHAELVPALLSLRDAGKIRFLGITEAFASDPQHQMLDLALEDDCWDVIMAGFNLINQSARARVLARTQEKEIGVLCMFAVRRALSQPEVLQKLISDLIAQGGGGGRGTRSCRPARFSAARWLRRESARCRLSLLSVRTGYPRRAVRHRKPGASGSESGLSKPSAPAPASYRTAQASVPARRFRLWQLAGVKVSAPNTNDL